jgi:hypothetical protein
MLPDCTAIMCLGPRVVIFRANDDEIMIGLMMCGPVTIIIGGPTVLTSSNAAVYIKNM